MNYNVHDWNFLYSNDPLTYVHYFSLSQKESVQDLDITREVPWIVNICGYLAAIAAITVTMAPIPIMIKFHRESSVGSLPLLPFSSMVINAFAWFTYGFLMSKPKLWIPNLVALPLTMFYVIQYIRYSRQKSTSLFRHLFILLFGIVTTAGSTVVLPFHLSSYVTGIESMLFSILRDSSSLASIPEIIRKKCADSIPLPVTIASLINCTLWVVYGIFDIDDAKVYVPNLIRLFSNLIQMFLVVKFGSRKNQVSGKVDTEKL